MNIAATVIADSISPQGIRLTTMQVTFHRFVLAEMNTHRVFSRSYRSSRAVPTAKLIDEVRCSPAMPVAWMRNQPGMQAAEHLPADEASAAAMQWRLAAAEAAASAEALLRSGLHKQWASRPLEPYLYVHGVITSTEWANFYALRCHPDAQPEIKALAEAMRAAQAQSVPKILKPREWHLPYVTDADRAVNPVSNWIHLSVARCARVSYRTFDGRSPNPAEDLALYDRLLGSAPLHASPAEHQATPDTYAGRDQNNQIAWDSPSLHGNLYGWIQYRKTLPYENAGDR